jgi:hypothetical protein
MFRSYTPLPQKSGRTIEAHGDVIHVESDDEDSTANEEPEDKDAVTVYLNYYKTHIETTHTQTKVNLTDEEEQRLQKKRTEFRKAVKALSGVVTSRAKIVLCTPRLLHRTLSKRNLQHRRKQKA